MMDNDNPPRDKEPSSLHPPRALTDPQILRTVGLDLAIADLQSCRLVSHFWYTHFSPFMYWILLEDLDAIYMKIKNSSPTSSRTSHDELYQAKLSELDHQVKLPSAAFDFHSVRWKFLKSGDFKCRRSFLHIALLVKETTQKFSYFNVDRRTLATDPQGVVDKACLAVEGSPALKSINFSGYLSKSSFYRWSESLEVITEMDARHSESEQMKAWASAMSFPSVSMVSRRLKTPLWPQLEFVHLSNVRCDPLFIRILLSHAPALQRLWIGSCIILTPEETQRPISELKRVLKMIQAHEGNDSKTEEASLDSNANIENSSLVYLSVCKVQGVFWKDILRLARRLPRLTGFEWEENDKGKPRRLLPSSSSSESQPPLLNILDITSAPLADVVRLVIDCKRLSTLRLRKAAVDLTLARAVALRAWTLSHITLEDCTIQDGGDEAPIVILCSVFTLEVFHVSGAVMKCDPLWLRTPWVCKGLSQLSVSPKCDGGGGDYTADMAQQAFMAQVAALLEIHLLDFLGGSGANGFYPEKSLHLLENLQDLELLNLKSPSVESSVVLTEEQAKLVVAKWPNLRQIVGVPAAGSDLFRDYVHKHRPEIDTTSESFTFPE